jgi:hypothetical protein
MIDTKQPYGETSKVAPSRSFRLTENFSEKDYILEAPSDTSSGDMGKKSKEFSEASSLPGTSDKHGVRLEHLETVNSTTPKFGKRKKIRQHFKRFWCCYLIAGIIFLAIFLPLL